jgi:hypothetical protein
MKIEELVFQDPVCFDCAEEGGLQPKPYPVGVWPDTCSVCGEEKPCTARRDWLGKIIR